MRKLTQLEVKVLRASRDDGALELTGIDKHPGATKHWYNSCLRLASEGFLVWKPTATILVDSWVLTDAGKALLAELDGKAK